jgi:hypothetical protein
MGDIEDAGDALADELTFDPDVDASGITVRTMNGEVILAGTVPIYAQYLAATAGARRIARGQERAERSRGPAAAGRRTRRRRAG